MIRFEKIPATSNSKGYFYYPEDKPGPGMIEIDVRTGEVFVAEQSSYDKELGVPYYANKARAEVKRLFESDNLVEKKILAWY